ncbi:hypothetical protein D3248_04110 [Leucobacter zeae]|nr:hypothetical protein [Leucobacter zeae]
MALMHRTTMSPSKLELLAGWLPSQPWFGGDASALASLGAYRFDDPEGEVGLEGHLLEAGDGKVYHVPLSYRGAPLDEGEEFLVGTSEHGVLGTRWISDGAGDPVFRAVLASAIALGGHEAEEQVQDAEGAVVPREIVTRVTGSGEPGAPVPELWAASVASDASRTDVTTGFATLGILRALDVSAETAAAPVGAQVLRATWRGQDRPVVIATLTV